MLYQDLLDEIIVDGTTCCAKVYNPNLSSPLVYSNDQEIVELNATQMINVPIFDDIELNTETLDLLLVQLILSCKRCATFDVLDTELKNIRLFIEKAITDFKEHVGTEIEKIAVIGKDLKAFREPFGQLLTAFEYIEFIEHPDFLQDIYIVPLDIKSGAIVMQGKSKLSFGMVLYEECVKKLSLYSDDDLGDIVAQLTDALEAGEL